jgi:hypothetical protein
MLVYGCCNPAGEEDSHRGVYLRKRDLSEIVSNNSLINLPVRVEHSREDVGHIVSAWKNGERLDCVLKINDNNIDGVFAQQFVQNGLCPELSLSYSVVMENSKDGLKGEKKEFIEVSLVRRGARPNCSIHGFSTK